MVLPLPLRAVSTAIEGCYLWICYAFRSYTEITRSGTVKYFLAAYLKGGKEVCQNTHFMRIRHRGLLKN